MRMYIHMMFEDYILRVQLHCAFVYILFHYAVFNKYSLLIYIC